MQISKSPCSSYSPVKASSKARSLRSHTSEITMVTRMKKRTAMITRTKLFMLSATAVRRSVGAGYSQGDKLRDPLPNPGRPSFGDPFQHAILVSMIQIVSLSMSCALLWRNFVHCRIFISSLIAMQLFLVNFGDRWRWTSKDRIQLLKSHRHTSCLKDSRYSIGYRTMREEVTQILEAR